MREPSGSSFRDDTQDDGVAQASDGSGAFSVIRLLDRMTAEALRHSSPPMGFPPAVNSRVTGGASLREGRSVTRIPNSWQTLQESAPVAVKMNGPCGFTRAASVIGASGPRCSVWQAEQATCAAVRFRCQAELAGDDRLSKYWLE